MTSDWKQLGFSPCCQTTGVFTMLPSLEFHWWLLHFCWLWGCSLPLTPVRPLKAEAWLVGVGWPFKGLRQSPLISADNQADNNGSLRGAVHDAEKLGIESPW